jgi:2-dehydro-3-deoxyphosphogluconate aldolase/(4S)-4-hydroxy-2-oxoglutarate aldolase
MPVLTKILEHKIVAIIRGADPSNVLAIARALQKGGVHILEVTLNSRDALRVIRELVASMGDDMIIGAGTVLTVDSAKAAIDAGARFIISPHVNPEIISATKQFGAVSIPGGYTATEIVHAYENGGDIIKVFPATAPEYINVLRGPLSHIPMMPTGGITPENIVAFKEAGAVAFGIGTSLVAPRDGLAENYLELLTEKARKFVVALS